MATVQRLKDTMLCESGFEIYSRRSAATSARTYFTVFLCSVRQKPLQIAMFWSLPWPKAPLFTVSVFLNLLSKNTAICDVFNNMVAKNTAICEVFYIFAQRAQASAMYKNTAKTNVSAKTVTQTAPKS